MVSRALSLATVMLLIGWFTAERAQAQVQNLEAGKSPSQIFAGTCSACHKSPRGLLKTVPPASLSGFLRQHYTTSPDMANVLSSYLASNGASDTRYVGAQPKGGKDAGKDAAKDGAREVRSDAKFDAKPDARPARPPDQLDRFGRRLHPAAASQDAPRPEAAIPEARPEARPEAAPDTKPDVRPDSEPRQAARPDVEEEAAPQPDEPVRPGRNAKRFDAKRLDAKRLDTKRLARPASEDARRPAADGQVPAHATNERGPDGRRLSAKQKLTKRGRPGEETPKNSSKDPFKEFFRDQPKGDTTKEEPSGSEPKGETAKVDPGKSDSNKSDSGSPDSARSDSGKPEEGSRQQSSKPVGEAPSQSAKAESGKAESGKAESGKAESGKAEPAKDGETSAQRPDQAPPTTPAPSSAVSASAPPAAPAGPPTPPISQ